MALKKLTIFILKYIAHIIGNACCGCQFKLDANIMCCASHIEDYTLVCVINFIYLLIENAVFILFYGDKSRSLGALLINRV